MKKAESCIYKHIKERYNDCWQQCCSNTKVGERRTGL